jgi:RNA polymerase-binding transcription factor DksA
MAEKTRFSDAELEEFRTLINEKLDQTNEEIDYYKDSIVKLTEETEGDHRSFDMEDGSSSMDKERLMQNLERQRKFKINLENAILRVNAKTYGICRVTGKLIQKERLRIVPHATLSMEAKENRS